MLKFLKWALVSLALCGDARGATIVETVTPIVQLSTGEIRACGFEGRQGDWSLRVQLQKTGGGTTLVISASGPTQSDAGGSASSINSVEVTDIRISGFESAVFAKGPDGQARVHRGSPDEASFMLQRLMLTGGEFLLGGEAAQILLALKGPLPQNVRATYLNCTGDMYRQE